MALDCLAVEVANQKLVVNNHEKYYREMLAGGIIQGTDKDIPKIEDTAREVSEYFWGSLYKPYLGVEVQKPRATDLGEKMIKDLLPLFDSGDMNGVQAWIKSNRQILKSSLPDIQGDTVFMLLTKSYNTFKHKSAIMSQAIQSDLQGDQQRFENMLVNWHEAIKLIARNSKQQLNIVDFKGQTPLMLMTEASDTNMVRTFLSLGSDPDKQDYHGMTALHSAIKSGVDSCVDTLLNHPCSTNQMTIDGRTVMHTAAWTANIHAIKRLLELPPQHVRQRDSLDLTPLELVEVLIEQPEARAELIKELRKTHRICPSKEQFKDVLQLLEQAPTVN